MDAETVNAIRDLTQQAVTTPELTHEVTLENGVTLTYRNDPTENGRTLGALITPPRPNALYVTTLTGFADALALGGYDPATHLVHVEDYLTVALKDRALDPWGNRNSHICAKYTPIEVFKFDYYYPEPARFIIALQVAFLITDELLYLIRLASNLKAGNTVQVQDDGFSQAVTVKTGEISTAEIKVKPRVKLIPLRSFVEAAPVESEFLIRFQQNSAGAPSIALFDVDGKKWQGELMQSIKKWLGEKIDALFPIIA